MNNWLCPKCRTHQVAFDAPGGVKCVCGYTATFGELYDDTFGKRDPLDVLMVEQETAKQRDLDRYSLPAMKGANLFAGIAMPTQYDFEVGSKAILAMNDAIDSAIRDGLTQRHTEKDAVKVNLPLVPWWWQGESEPFCHAENDLDLYRTCRGPFDSLEEARADQQKAFAAREQDEREMASFVDMVKEAKRPLIKSGGLSAAQVNAALDLIKHYGGIDGGHHKQWVLDQTIRLLTLTNKGYHAWVKDYQAGEDGPDTYEWDQGIAP